MSANSAIKTTLNPEQKEAVENINGPMLVLAGAGTGKTTVLVERIKNIIKQYNNPDGILATTFTIKATEEMRVRLEKEKLTPPEWIGTFHSLCIKILRQHPVAAGLDAKFAVIDGTKQKTLCQKLFGQKADETLEQIQQWKNNCKYPSDVNPYHQNHADYIRYEKNLQEENALDFCDLILRCCKLWKENPEILEEYQRKFQFVCIDEFQDTNAAQFLWLKTLTSGQERPNLFCVGDDDQAIYMWRGSDNKYILNFHKTYQNAKIVKLEQNYRSTENIINAALSIVEQNQQRIDKILLSNKGEGSKIQIKTFMDSRLEGEWVAQQIIKQDGSVGILVRTTWQIQEISRVLNSKGISSGENLKILLRYLHFINIPTPQLFTKIITKPKRGIGSSTLEKFEAICNIQSGKREITLDLMKEILCEVCTRSSQKAGLELLFEQIDHWKTINNPQDLILDIWQKLSLANDINPTPPFHLLKAAMDSDNLLSLLKKFKMPDVSVLTIHAAKGLEFDTTFLMGWEEYVFPHAKSILTGDLESERRLAYVAITRARNHAYITKVQTRHSPRGLLRKGPSRFLAHIPEHLTDG